MNFFYLKYLKYVFLVLMICLTACSSQYEASGVAGKKFPSVHAEILTGEKVILPEVFANRPIILLIGYVQKSQFDIDRWILALMQMQTPIGMAELPVIQGFVPNLLSSRINEGMRAGIPVKDHAIVYTIYDDADKVAKFLGNQNAQHARVVVLDKDSVVRWVYDQGYSPETAIKLDKFIREQIVSES